MEVAGSYGDEQGVVVAISEAGAEYGRGDLLGGIDHAVWQHPTRVGVEVAPDGGDGGRLEVGDVGGDKFRRAACCAFAISGIHAAERRFKEGLYRDVGGRNQRAFAAIGGTAQSQKDVGVSLRKGLAAQGGHIGHAVQIHVLQLVADDPSDVAGLESCFIADGALDRKSEIVGALGAVTEVEGLGVLHAGIAVDPGEIRLGERGRGRRERSRVSIYTNAKYAGSVRAGAA